MNRKCLSKSCWNISQQKFPCNPCFEIADQLIKTFFAIFPSYSLKSFCWITVNLKPVGNFNTCRKAQVEASCPESETLINSNFTYKFLLADN